ncbi:hypothetical protein V8E51_007102 [Hyaloscypha variabilis]
MSEKNSTANRVFPFSMAHVPFLQLSIWNLHKNHVEMFKYSSPSPQQRKPETPASPSRPVQDKHNVLERILPSSTTQARASAEVSKWHTGIGQWLHGTSEGDAAHGSVWSVLFCVAGTAAVRSQKYWQEAIGTPSQAIVWSAAGLRAAGAGPASPFVAGCVGLLGCGLLWEWKWERSDGWAERRRAKRSLRSAAGLAWDGSDHDSGSIIARP